MKISDEEYETLSKIAFADVEEIANSVNIIILKVIMDALQ